MTRTLPTLLLAACLLALAGCGGNWSDDDVEFLNALPRLEDLKAKLPESGQAQGGLGVRRDGLVGEASEAYQETRSGSGTFNGGLFALLAIIDTVRGLPPSERDGDRRLWGPFPDENRPLFENRVVIERTLPTRFAWSIDSRPRRESGDQGWVSVITGEFNASGGARKGEGTMALHAQRARDGGIPTPDLLGLDTLTVDYDTRDFPLQVTMTLTAVGGERLDYAYLEHEDGSGRLIFRLEWSANAQREAGTAQVLSRWQPSGAGRADMEILEGPWTGYRTVECWSDAFTVTYVDKPWVLQEGAPESCVYPAP